MKKALVLLLVLLLNFLYSMVAAQYKQPANYFELQLKVLDSLSGMPLNFATTQISKHKHFHFTDDRGEVAIDSIKSGLNLLQISFIGYHSFEKVLDFSKDLKLVVYLCPVNFHLHEFTIHSHEELGLNSENQSRVKLSSSQIQKSAGILFSDLFKQIPGMQTLSSGPAISKPIIRGLHSNRIAILNNGTKLESQNWGAEHGPEIDPFSADEIELIKGASSVEYGPEAIGGVIKISPKPYRKMQGIDGVFSLNSFSNNRALAISNLINGTHGNKKHFNWKFQSSYKFAGDASTPEYVISNTGFRELDLALSSHYQITEALGIEIISSAFQTELGIMRAAHISNTSDLKRAITSDKPLFIEPFTYTIDKPKQDVSHYVLATKVNYSIPKIGLLHFQYSYQMNHRMEYDRGVSWNPSSPTHSLPAYDLKLYSGIFNLQFEHKEIRKFKGKIGLDFLSQSNISSGTQKPIIPNFVAQTFGLFAFEKFRTGRWNFEAGSRFDIRSQSVYQRTSNTNVDELKKNFSGLTFVGSLAYHLNSDFQVQFTQSSAWRAPSVNELYSYGLHNGLASFEIGNEKLVPEFALNSDLGLKFKNELVSIDFNLYRNSINHFIYAKPDTSPTLTVRGAFPTFRYTQTKALLSGFEFQLSKPVWRNYLFTCSYAYLFAQDLTNNQALINMPSNRLKASFFTSYSNLKMFSNFMTGFDFDYVFRQSRYVEGLDYIAPPPAYLLINFQTSFIFKSKNTTINFVMGAKNLFNVSYRDYMNRFRYFTDEPGRNIYISFQIPIQYYNPIID